MHRPQLAILAAGLLGSLMLATPVFAHGLTLRPEIGPPGNNNPSPPPSNFELTAFTASPTTGPGAYNFDLHLTVTQTSLDGSDVQEEPKGATSEFHAFPSTIYVELLNSSGTAIQVSGSTAVSATLVSGTGITYGNTQTGDVSANAVYLLSLPNTVPASPAGYTVEIYPPDQTGPTAPPGQTPTLNQAQLETFRMGPQDDPSWGDDIVDGTTTLTPPVGQLPEVPWAAGLPLVGLAAAAGLWSRRRAASRL
jgi:hypothetical protein